MGVCYVGVTLGYWQRVGAANRLGLVVAFLLIAFDGWWAVTHAADTAKIVGEAYKIFGELPYNDYTFIVNLRGGGGLEHLNSTALQFNRFGFKPDARYVGFLGLVAHEYFHAFNVKRIRPDALGPFDYENENYTRLRWVAEGGTEYYSNLLLRRAGLITQARFQAGQLALSLIPDRARRVLCDFETLVAQNLRQKPPAVGGARIVDRHAPPVGRRPGPGWRRRRSGRRPGRG